MPTSIYKSLNFGDLEPTEMTIQLANKSVIQPLGVLENVLVQVNELIFPANFYVLDMEDETSGKRSTLILGQPFLMIARIKIDVHVETLLMEFGDNLVQFNIFEAMKHPIKDHSLFGIDLIDEQVEEYLQLDNEVMKFQILLETLILSDSKDAINDLPHLSLNYELLDLIDQVCKYDEEPECSKSAKV
ncbi:hypothetical protein CR513_07287, partial [Mucuna pruriens]